jgi:hypothetical protein
VYGVYSLEKVLTGRELDFCLLFSSNASILGGLGSVGYAAANLFMDAVAQRHSQKPGTPWISVNWDGWLMQGASRLASSFETSLDQYAMTPQEGVEAFQRLLSSAPVGQILVSTGNLDSRLDLWIRRKGSADPNEPEAGPSSATLHARPALGTAYAPPSHKTEQAIVLIWQDLLGIEQVGIHDNFFELGGNSLIGLKVISRLKAELNADIPIVALFEGPTISSLAKVIAGDQSKQSALDERRSRGERRRHKHQGRQKGPTNKAGNPIPVLIETAGKAD